jgi:hypothetical protein
LDILPLENIIEIAKNLHKATNAKSGGFGFMEAM